MFICQDTVIEHMETLDPENPRDVIDQYLLEKEKEKNNPNSPYRDDCKNCVTLILEILISHATLWESFKCYQIISQLIPSNWAIIILGFSNV